ncbi:MAG: glycerophosphodiester phosphodiesterase [Pleomorphochaeta sp.]
MISYYQYKDKPILFAHRGMNSFAPENSLEAFQLCLENNIPAIELDVHMIKSGEIVVIHDSSTKRLTKKDYTIEKLTLSEIKELDIGINFNENFKNTKIPTLEEVFQLCSNNVLYDIEIKSNSIKNLEFAKKLWNLIRKYKLEFNTIITSFNPIAVKEFEKVSNHSLLEGAIFSKDKEVPFLLRKGLGSYMFNCNIIKPQLDLITENSVQDWKARNLKILPWCVDDQEKAIELLNYNIMGIISNVPEQLIKTKYFKQN